MSDNSSSRNTQITIAKACSYYANGSGLGLPEVSQGRNRHDPRCAHPNTQLPTYATPPGMPGQLVPP
jgi:hypothetical protein